jgi:tetratricopeptide (TPR) repeat protein
LFRRLSIFVSNAGWEAIARVCAIDQDDEEAIDVLIAHHLIQPLFSDTPEVRVRMLDTIHAFGRELLQASGEAAEIEQRYAAYYLHVAQTALTQSVTTQRASAAKRLDEDYANLIAALRWLQMSGDLEQALQLAHALAWYWIVRGQFSEGRAWLDPLLRQAAAAEDACTPRTHAWALASAGRLAYHQGHYQLAEAEAQRALDLFTASGESSGQIEAWNVLGLAAEKQSRFDLARERYLAAAANAEAIQDHIRWGMAAVNLGNIALLCGDIPTATAYYEAGLAHYQKTATDPSKIARVLGNLATIASMADEYDRAWHLYQQTLAAMMAIGDADGIATTYMNLGSVAQKRGDLDNAHELIELGLQQQRTIGNNRGVAVALRSLGCVFFEQHAHEKALACFQESLCIHAQIHSQQGITLALHEIARVACAAGHLTEAIRLVALVQHHAQELKMAWSANEAEQHACIVQAGRESLEAAVFSTIWQEGTSWELSDAIQHALHLLC